MGARLLFSLFTGVSYGCSRYTFEVYNMSTKPILPLVKDYSVSVNRVNVKIPHRHSGGILLVAKLECNNATEIVFERTSVLSRNTKKG